MNVFDEAWRMRALVERRVLDLRKLLGVDDETGREMLQMAVKVSESEVESAEELWAEMIIAAAEGEFE